MVGRATRAKESGERRKRKEEEEKISKPSQPHAKQANPKVGVRAGPKTSRNRVFITRGRQVLGPSGLFAAIGRGGGAIPYAVRTTP